ncbi:MAG: patatin [Sphingomonadales bacterium]|nr:patatin [Sphingomonadales bacterium]
MADIETFQPRRARKASRLPLPDKVALVLQGGGALGSYQAGVYEALEGAGIEVDEVAGISIGAVNAALIAGNRPEDRLEALRKFWDRATAALPSLPIWHNDFTRELVHEMSAAFVAMFGVPGFFSPRTMPVFAAAPGSAGALSFYDSSKLASTLDELVDWDLLNNGPVRIAVGAVEVESGNFNYFDSANERLDARHIMASGALPPGLPPIEIDGKLWWDGGLVSNTPLQHVLDTQDAEMIVFQVDLFPAAASRPKTIMDVMAREKEIRFSSRTRQVSDQMLKLRREREAIRKVLKKLPAELLGDVDVKRLAEMAREFPVNVVQLIYRANAWEGGSRDYEFSARTMNEHWQAGKDAVSATVENSALIAQNIGTGHTAVFDLTPR